MTKSGGFAIGVIVGALAGAAAAALLVPSSPDARRDRIRALADAASAAPSS